MTPDRPESLPDYSNPPLQEVCLAIQFDRPEKYNQMEVHNIWTPFKADYPASRIEPRLAPLFETFVSDFQDSLKSEFQLSAIQGPVENRCVFSSPNNANIIQFQSDRFAENWRRDQDEAYPRYEVIRANFENNAELLEGAFKKLDWGPVSPNLCEMSYVNLIAIKDIGAVASQVKFVPAEKMTEIEGFNYFFSRQLFDAESNPYARLYVHAATTFSDKNEKVLRLALTVRGVPKRNTVASCLEFFDKGRVEIVETFTSVTSGEAHQAWKRTN